jgi:hypothetical protein
MGCLLMSWFLGAQKVRGIQFSAEYQDEPLPRILQDLEEEFGLTFSYLANTLDEKIISANFSDASWEELVAELFGRADLGAKVLEDGYVIITKLPPEAVRPQEVCLQVLDEAGKPLPFVTVSVNGSSQSFYADAEGWCRRTLRAADTDSLHLQFIGYGNRVLSFAEVGGNKCPGIQLLNSGVDLASVLVLEYLTDGVEATREGREVKIKVEKIPALPGFTEKEVYRSVQLLPGISNSNESAGDLNIRGGSRDQTQIIWDGISVYSTGHYFGMISLFSPELVENMRVWRGQADASFGGRLSGVVEMTSDRKITESPQLGGGISFTHADAFLKVPVIKDKSDLHLAVRTSVNNLFNSPTYSSFQRQVFQADNSILPEEVPVEDSLTIQGEGFNFTEFNGRWQWNLGAATQLTVSGFTQINDFAFDLESTLFEADENFTQQISSSSTGYGLTLSHDWSGGRNLGFQLASSTYTASTLDAYRLDDFEEEDFFSYEESRESTIRDGVIRLDYQHSTGTKHLLKAGLEALRLESYHDFIENEEGEIEIVSRQDSTPSNSLSVYLADTWRPNDRWQLAMGIRLPYYFQTERLYPEPRLTVTHFLNQQWTIKGGVGVNHQFFNEVVEIDGDNVGERTPLWQLVDTEEDEVPRSVEVTFGALWSTRGWLLDLELYTKQMDNLASLNQELTNAIDEDFFDIPAVTLRTSGVDVLLKKRWRNFSSWAIYTLSQTELQFTLDEGEDAEFSISLPAQNDVRHRFRWVNALETDRWIVSLGWQCNSGVRFTPTFIDEIEEEDAEAGIPLNASRLRTFHRLDLSAFYRWGSLDTNKKVRGKVGISLLNLYDQENFIGAGFRPGGEDGERRRLIFRRGLGFTPSLSASIRW